MAEILFNYGDKFTQTSDSNTGIGSTIPAGKLDVAGGASAGSLRVSGIASLSSYQGFVNTKLSTTEDLIVEAGKSGSVSGEIVIGTGQTISVSTGATTGQGGIQSLKVFETFMPPVGGTVDRPTDVKPGMVYYNKDFKTIEFWDGNFWKQVDNISTGGRALFCGGDTTPSGDYTRIIDFCVISSTGSTRNFGDAGADNMTSFGIGNNSRGIFGVGGNPNTDTLEYVTISSEGDAKDFSNLTSSRYGGARGNSSTRGIFMGGQSYSDVIDYVEMSTLANALDFGDLTVGTFLNVTSVNTKTRVFSLGGYVSPGVNTAKVEFVTTSSKGNGISFGEIDRPNSTFPAFSNDTRAIYGGGNLRPGSTSEIFIFNMFTQGETTFFGDLTQARYEFAGSCSQTRGVFVGGQLPDSPNASANTIDFITMATTGNAIDFGDMTKVSRNLTSLSDCHGGLGGF